MGFSAYILVVLSGILLTGSLVSIFVLLDKGAQDTINNVMISNLQEKTVALSSKSLRQELTRVEPIAKFFLLNYETGNGFPTTMTDLEFASWAMSTVRFMMLGFSPFIYYSDEMSPNTWGDVDCFEEGGWFCARLSPPTEAQYFYANLSQPLDGNWIKNSELLSYQLNYTGEYYIQAIAAMTRAQMNGSWTKPYLYSWVEHAGVKGDMALQTLVYPLRFNNDTGLCTYSFSIDVDLSLVSHALNRVRASKDSLLFILDATDKNMIISTSNTEVSLWNNTDESKPMWNRFDHPMELVRDASRAVVEHIPQATLLDAPDGHFEKLQRTIHGTVYLIATRHVRDRDLLWVIVDVTPRDFYYKTLDEARVTSISIGAAIGFVALLVTVVCFVVLVSALADLGHQMKYVSEMKLDSVPKKEGLMNRITELSAIQSSFFTMVDCLREYKSYIPLNVFHNDDDDVDSDEDSDEASTVLDESRPESPDVVDMDPVRGDSLADSPLQRDIPPFVAPPSPISSRKSSNSSSLKSSNASEGSGGSPNKKPGLSRPLSVVKDSCIQCFNLVGTHNLLLTVSIDAFRETHTKHVSHALAVTQRHRGIPVLFSGDVFVVAYNVLSRCTSKAYHACASAMELCGGPGAPWTSGTSVGEAVCGDLGPPGMRSFAIVGAVFDEAMFLQRLNASYKTRNLCSGGGMYSDVSIDFSVRIRDVLPYAKAVAMGSMLVVEVIKSQLGEDEQDSEWLYNLEADAGMLIDFNQLVAGRYFGNDTGRQMKELFLENHPPSNSALNMALRQDLERILHEIDCPSPPTTFNY